MFNEYLKSNMSGNIIGVEADAKKVIPLAMIRYKAIYDYLSQQLASVIFKASGVVCEPIFKYSKNIPSQYEISWQVYSKEREMPFSNMVIILWKWNKLQDISRQKHFKCSESTGINAYNQYPNLKVGVHCCSKLEIKEIQMLLTDFDQILDKGIRLKERGKKGIKEIKWNEIDIFRSYDWGQISCAWNRSKVNGEIEVAAESLEKALFHLLNQPCNTNNEKLVFDYPYPVDDYIKIVYEGMPQ